MLNEENLRIIKKYQNRKLYDTKDSCYITLDEIAVLIRKGEEIKVVDNKTKNDVTSIIMTQILVEQEKGSRSILPISLLRDLIQKGQGSLYEFIQRYVLLGIVSEQDRQQEAERYLDRLVSRGELNKIEAKNILKEVVEGPEEGRSNFDQYIGQRLTSAMKDASHLSEVEGSVSTLSSRLESVERKITDYERR